MIVILSIGTPAASATPSGVASPLTETVALDPTRSKSPTTCLYARLGVAFYRGRYTFWQVQREASVLSWRKPRNCPDARFLAGVWKKRAYASRVKTRKYLSELARRTLEDFEFKGIRGNNAWPKAVRQAQRVFPGTESWLLSCSDAEGWSPGSDLWVTYGGGSYYPGLEDKYIVGGPMQFKYPTFTGMFRRAVEYAVSKDFIIPSHLRSDGVSAWRSALGQALAAGWARYTGNDNSHWAASWGNGC